VPLNHSEPSGAKISLALARIPSPLAGHQDYRGPILLNPGGPAASGVDFLLDIGLKLSAIVGPQFDIVGFDPRGTLYAAYLLTNFLADQLFHTSVARSEPTIDFF
jgi:hypothetical protein